MISPRWYAPLGIEVSAQAAALWVPGRRPYC